MSAREEIVAALAAMRARLDAATPGPWSRDYTYLVGMVRGGRPNGEVFANMSPSVPHHFPHADLIANADLIVAAVNREQRVIDHVTRVLARHREWPDVEIEHQEECDNCDSPDSVKPCTITACQGCYSVSDDGMTVAYVEHKDCPEVASVHAMVVGP